MYDTINKSWSQNESSGAGLLTSTVDS